MIWLRNFLLVAGCILVSCNPNYLKYKEIRKEYTLLIEYGKYQNGNPINYPFELKIQELNTDKTEYLIHFTKEDTLVRIRYLIQNDSVNQEINYYYKNQKLKVCAFQDKKLDTSSHHFYIEGKFEKTQLKLCKDISSHYLYFVQGQKFQDIFIENETNEN